MATFDFQSKVKAQTSVFNGPLFYNTYKDSEMLRVDSNIEGILRHGYLIRQEVKRHPPGHSVVIAGVNLEKNTPLILKRGGKGVHIGDLEFTYNRLIGLVAAYVFENRARFPKIESSDAKALGLEWDNGNEEKCRLYLSALYGTENMIDQFSYFPFLCALRKCQLNKMLAKDAVGLGYVKNNQGETMMKVMKKNLSRAKRIWEMFPGATVLDLTILFDETPEFRKLYQG